jgi:hypothetical protein
VDVVWFVPWKPYISASGNVFDLLALQMRKSLKGGRGFLSLTGSTGVAYYQCIVWKLIRRQKG